MGQTRSAAIVLKFRLALSNIFANACFLVDEIDECMQRRSRLRALTDLPLSFSSTRSWRPAL